MVAAAAALAAASCSKAFEADVPAVGEESPMTLTARIAEAGTKVDYSILGSVKQAWNDSDRLLGIDNDGLTYTFKIKEIFDNKTARFERVTDEAGCGTATTNPAKGKTLHLIYAPGHTADDFTGSPASMTLDLTSQSATAAGAPIDGENIPGIMTASGTVDIETLDLTFSNRTELVTIQNPVFDGLTSGTVTAFRVRGSTGLPLTATFAADGSFTPGSTTGTVTKACSLAIGSDGVANGTVVVAVFPEAKQDLKITAITSAGNYLTTVEGHSFAAGGWCKLLERKFTEKPYSLTGVFSVGADPRDVVQFSRGNLFAKDEDGDGNWTWGLYVEQYLFNPASMSPSDGTYRRARSTDKEIDLFNWGYGPWSTQPVGATHLEGYSSGQDFAYPSEDWGSQIGDGHTWRTMPKKDWEWMLGPNYYPTPGTNCRTSSTVNGVANARFAMATVNGVNGLMIFPDSFTVPAGVSILASSINNPGGGTNSFDLSQWDKLEDAGAAFLPFAGLRLPPSTPDVDVAWVGSFNCGTYNSSTSIDENFAVVLRFKSGGFGYSEYKNEGHSVRLVKYLYPRYDTDIIDDYGDGGLVY